MKRETIITTIMTIMATSLIVSIICGIYYVPKLKSEYIRGMNMGAGYYKKHGEYPSHWHWNKKYENENFNIDTTYFLTDTTAIIYYNSSFGNVDTILKRHK